MKSRSALLTVLLSASATVLATPSFAATASANYFQADSLITVAALLLAGSSLAAANLVSQKRNARLEAVKVIARAPSANKWQRKVYQNLEAELQAYSSQFREAA